MLILILVQSVRYNTAARLHRAVLFFRLSLRARRRGNPESVSIAHALWIASLRLAMTGVLYTQYPLPFPFYERDQKVQVVETRQCSPEHLIRSKEV